MSALDVSAEINITRNFFGEFCPDGTFDGLTSLQYLNLQDNRIHLLNETSISSNVLNGLQKLYLSRNSFTAHAILCGSMIG
jgi:Leucine-rich repeat (LRR) protein